MLHEDLQPAEFDEDGEELNIETNALIADDSIFFRKGVFLLAETTVHWPHFVADTSLRPMIIQSRMVSSKSHNILRLLRQAPVISQ